MNRSNGSGGGLEGGFVGGINQSEKSNNALRELQDLYSDAMKRLMEKEFLGKNKMEIDWLMVKLTLAYDLLKGEYYNQRSKINNDNSTFAIEHSIETTKILINEFPDVTLDEMLIALMHGILLPNSFTKKESIENIFDKQIADNISCLTKGNVLTNISNSQCQTIEILEPKKRQEYVLNVVYPELEQIRDKKYFDSMKNRNNSTLKVKFADIIHTLRNIDKLSYGEVKKIVGDVLNIYLLLAKEKNGIAFKLIDVEINIVLEKYPFLKEEYSELIDSVYSKIKDSIQYKLPEEIIKFYKKIKNKLINTEFKDIPKEDIDKYMHMINTSFNLSFKEFYRVSREDGEDYFDHGLEVANILMNEFSETNLKEIIEALLHDVIEDTKISKKTLENIFPYLNIANGVDDLTKENRKLMINEEQKIKGRGKVINYRKNFIKSKEKQLNKRIEKTNNIYIISQELMYNYLGDNWKEYFDKYWILVRFVIDHIDNISIDTSADLVLRILLKEFRISKDDFSKMYGEDKSKELFLNSNELANKLGGQYEEIRKRIKDSYNRSIRESIKKKYSKHLEEIGEEWKYNTEGFIPYEYKLPDNNKIYDLKKYLIKIEKDDLNKNSRKLWIDYLEELKPELKKIRDKRYYAKLATLDISELKVKIADRVHNLRTIYVMNENNIIKKINEVLIYFYPVAIKRYPEGYELLKVEVDKLIKHLNQKQLIKPSRKRKDIDKIFEQQYKIAYANLKQDNEQNKSKVLGPLQKIKQSLSQTLNKFISISL